MCKCITYIVGKKLHLHLLLFQILEDILCHSSLWVLPVKNNFYAPTPMILKKHQLFDVREGLNLIFLI